MTIIFLRLTCAFGLSLLSSCNETPKAAAIVLDKPVLPQFKSPIISQNSKHLKSGEKLEITIQTEPFSDTSNQRVKIDGIDIPSELTDQASMAKYITKVRGAFGPHAIIITVSHFIRDKEIKIDRDTVVYTIYK